MKLKFFKKHKRIIIPLLIGITLYLLNSTTIRIFISNYPQYLDKFMGAGSWWITQPLYIQFLYVGILAPFIEELIFRKGILNLFLKYKLKISGLVLSSILFGYWHMIFGWGVLKGLNMALVGLVFGSIFMKYKFRGSLIAHYANNLMAMANLILLTWIL